MAIIIVIDFIFGITENNRYEGIAMFNVKFRAKIIEKGERFGKWAYGGYTKVETSDSIAFELNFIDKYKNT